ncbi:17853_t:CDS:2 [Racocetra persica]|uniref:17853_t:CDS:1 n=1 Tax=Racocetra persica TaxID=160502 RepID=A0ACA9KVZ2_9GLOM|nr:17853_t:CDS:2 [Racocetra persica]
MTLPTLPEELKFINGFLQRAQELRNREPVIAYYCNFYSVKLALEKGTKSKESKAFLARLLDVLEEEKKALHDNEAVTNDVVGEAYVENFGIKIKLYVFGFLEIQKKLITIIPNRKTAKNFLAAAVFLELLKVFGPLNPEIEEKIRYAKWKATDIVKALKEGQTPAPGPPGGEPALQPPLKEEDYVVNPSDNVPSIDQFPSAPLAVDSPSVSHMEENGLQLIPGFTNDSLPHQPPSSFPNNPPSSFPNNPPSSLPNNPPPPPPPPSLIPGLTNDPLRHQIPSSFPSNPPPLPPSIPGFTNDSLRHQPPSSFPSNPPLSQNYVQPYSSPIYQPTTPSSLPANQHPSSLPTNQHPSSLPINQQHVRHYTQFSHHSVEIDPNIVASAQKHCKWAISALNYNDVKTAVENMHKALAMLEPYNHK